MVMLDSLLTTLTLCPRHSPRSTSTVALREVIAVHRGADAICARMDLDHDIAQDCVVVDLSRPSGEARLVFWFELPTLQKQFAECLKVLRMSVDHPVDPCHSSAVRPLHCDSKQ
mmetsp:Transcript_10572/g.22869  ORF Transcript_10572/g.22869 Transcript_10572/m.22869 type:complete len:114 (+) Transcript_10572:458-799(+)